MRNIDAPPYLTVTVILSINRTFSNLTAIAKMIRPSILSITCSEG
ncbi:hypothetical protein protein [Bacillus cereus G9241]|nr:hypothetical protein protein [Bacillus cereus G9241]